MSHVLQFMSDLHLDRTGYQLEIPRAAPYLALVGDIGRLCDYDEYAGFLRKQCQIFDKVLLVAGNNEFYGSSRQQGLEAAATLVHDPTFEGKLAFLNRTRTDLTDSIIILGCTLHSHITPGHAHLNKDFKRITDWSIEDHNEEHKLDVKWLQSSLQQIAEKEPRKRVLILTHHAPSFKNTCHPSHENNAVSQCFCSNTLEAFIHWEGHEQVSDWIFGHTHWNARFVCGKTVVQSNCLPNRPRDLAWWERLMFYRPSDPRATIKSELTLSWRDWLVRA